MCYLNAMSRRGTQKRLCITCNKIIHMQSIVQWIKNTHKILEKEIAERQKQDSKFKQIKILEMDELFTYIKKPKNRCNKIL